jgi:hypothetical protein
MIAKNHVSVNFFKTILISIVEIALCRPCLAGITMVNNAEILYGKKVN